MQTDADVKEHAIMRVCTMHEDKDYNGNKSNIYCDTRKLNFRLNLHYNNIILMKSMPMTTENTSAEK